MPAEFVWSEGLTFMTNCSNPYVVSSLSGSYPPRSSSLNINRRNYHHLFVIYLSPTQNWAH